MTGPSSPARLTTPPGERDHRLGPATAPVTLVEYGDFECPHCGRAYPMLEALRQQAGNQLSFVYRHFPLSGVHPHAQAAAEAAEAAGAQGKFWQMHDLLFENQMALKDHYLSEYAALLGLDLRRFANEVVEHVHAPRVREDFLSGVRSGVNGTPTFFLNGIRYDGPHELAPLFAAVEAAARADRPARARPGQKRVPPPVR